MLIKAVINNEQNLVDLLSKYKEVKGRYKYYFDDSLKDMYDHNFFLPLTNIDKSLLEEMLKEKEKNQNSHIKIHCLKEEPFLEEQGFEKEVLLIMLKSDLNLTIPNNNLIFKSLEKEDISNDLLTFELKHYGKAYGEDFTKRKMNRYFDACRKNKGLNFLAAYLDNKIVCSCYVYYSEGVLALDGLVTDIDFRHQKIATSLIAYAFKYYGCPIYLHADNDETPKEIYKNLGFDEIYRIYDYLKTDKIDK